MKRSNKRLEFYSGQRQWDLALPGGLEDWLTDGVRST